MTDAAVFSRLVGTIYDAALEPAAWPGAIQQLTTFIGGLAGCLLTYDACSEAGEVFYGFGDQPSYRQLYFSKYIQHDPVGPALLAADVGAIVSNSDVTPTNEFLDTQFYQEWMRPQGWIDNVFCPLVKSPTGVTTLAIARGGRDSSAIEQVRERMRLIARHVRHAVSIGGLIGTHNSAAASLADSLDGISAATIFVNHTGRIVHANTRGVGMLSEGTLLRSVGGRFALHDAEANRRLREIFAPCTDGNIAISRGGITIPLMARNDMRYVLRILPLASPRRRAIAEAHRASAIIFVHRTAVAPLSQPEALRAHLQLTPSEFRVLLTLARISSVREVAETLHLSQATVKTHLHRIFTKTGARRQSDLIRLVSSYGTPLAG